MPANSCPVSAYCKALPKEMTAECKRCMHLTRCSHAFAAHSLHIAGPGFVVPQFAWLCLAVRYLCCCMRINMAKNTCDDDACCTVDVWTCRMAFVRHMGCFEPQTKATCMRAHAEAGAGRLKLHSHHPRCVTGRPASPCVVRKGSSQTLRMTTAHAQAAVTALL